MAISEQFGPLATSLALVGVCEPFWPPSGVEDDDCPFLRQLFAADQATLVLQPIIAPPQHAWAPSHWQRQHTRRKRQQHQFQGCPTGDALEQQQQERLLKCQRWVCVQDEAPAHSEQPGLELELEAASAGGTGVATDGPQLCSSLRPCSSDTASNCSSLDGAGTGGGSPCSRGEAAAARASRDSVSTSSCSSPAAVQDSAAGAAAQAEPAQAMQPCQMQPQDEQQERLPLQPAAAAGSAGDAESAAADVDDVSAQKAAAQARFAAQQRMEAVNSSKAPSVLFDADLLQQEQARLLQPGYQTRMFACALLSNLLCCLVLLAAKGPVGRVMGGSPALWPLLLALCACLGWVFMSKLKPLHFADAALEQHFAVRSQHGRGLLDIWFSLAGCSGLWAAAHRDTGSASSARVSAAAAAAEAPMSPLALLQLTLLLSLMAVLLAAAVLVVVAPKTYRRWREQLIFVGKVAMVSGLVSMQPGSGFSGVTLEQQPAWLSFLTQDSPHSPQAANVLLAVSTVQALLLLALMVRVSAYLPMQLIHVAALLTTVLNSGSSGFGVVLYAVQLLAFGLWAPTLTLVHLELSARRSFLNRHLSPGWAASLKGF